jgi:hypothetical protein
MRRAGAAGARNGSPPEYAELYREAYGQAEPVQELIPAMLVGFLDGDRAFARRRRKHGREAA